MAAVKRGFFLKRAATGLFGALAVVLSAMAGAAETAETTETIVILDASRSMWGQVGNKAKYLMVHDAVAGALERDERVVPKIGLISYGNTSPSRCNDISLNIKPSTADRDDFLNSMRDIKPWGLTPISAALRRAAESFSSATRAPRMVLFADGIENCGGDPCNTALELKSRIPGLTIDVVALDVGEDQREKLSCMATMTGGAFIAASTQAELDRAGETMIDRIVAAGRQPSDRLAQDTPDNQDAEPAQALMRARLPQPNPRAQIRKLVQLEPRSKPERRGTPSDRPAGVPSRLAKAPEQIAPPPRGEPASVEPAADDTAPDETAPEADLLQTAAISDADAPVAQDRHQTSLDPAPDRIASRAQNPETSVESSPVQQPELDIRNQDAPNRQGIKLRAKLTAEMRKIGKPLDWTVYKVEDADRALWKQVAAVRAPEPTFKLDPGTYLVRARYGYIAASKMVAVSEGKLTDATFVLNAGGLRVLSHLVFVDAPVDTAAMHYVYTGETDDNGVRQLIAKSETQGEIIRLNAGRYRVISRLGDANSVVSTDVEVSPGVLTAVEVNHKAGVLSLEVKGGPDRTDAAAINLVVFDTDGRLVVRMHGAEATTVLAPGRYTISAERGGRKATEDVDIRIGELKPVLLTIK
jgi:Ca-activated chloride channel family protein